MAQHRAKLLGKSLALRPSHASARTASLWSPSSGPRRRPAVIVIPTGVSNAGCIQWEGEGVGFGEEGHRVLITSSHCGKCQREPLPSSNASLSPDLSLVLALSPLTSPGGAVLFLDPLQRGWAPGGEETQNVACTYKPTKGSWFPTTWDCHIDERPEGRERWPTQR